MTEIELEDFQPGRGIPKCVLEARPLCDNFPQLLHKIKMNGIRPPHDELILSYRPSSEGKLLQINDSPSSQPPPNTKIEKRFAFGYPYGMYITSFNTAL